MRMLLRRWAAPATCTAGRVIIARMVMWRPRGAISGTR